MSERNSSLTGMEMECFQKLKKILSVELNINEPADGYTKDQLSKGLKGTKIFTVKQINIV
jgi:hypothetical protein